MSKPSPVTQDRKDAPKMSAAVWRVAEGTGLLLIVELSL